MPLDQVTASRPEIVHSVCPHDCPSACALDVERWADGRIGRVRGADMPYTSGVVCAKVARYAERHHHPERLTRPLLRTGDKGVGRAAFREIGWEEALGRIAEAFLAAERRDGPEAVWPYYYAGTMGLVQRDGIERLRHAKRYSGLKLTVCSALTLAGWLAGVGVQRGVSALEIEKSDLVVVWGANPVSTQVNLMTHISRARKARGAKLVVVDPYRTGTAEQADLHLMPRPGTDGALACALVHVLLREGLADRDYLARLTDWDEGLEAHFAERDPAWAEAITGIPAAEIEAFARLYGSTQRSYLRVGYGFSRSRNGAANLHAVSCLPAVTGAWQVEGGGAHQSNSGLYPIDATLIEGEDMLDPAIRVLDMCEIGPVLTGDPRALKGGPPVAAMLIQNTNPMVIAPDSLKVARGFARPDLFVAVHEQFMTETAAMADVVLPATTFLEHDDLYIASGHTFLQFAGKVVEPPGECRPNHFVICELARHLGAEHAGFHLSEREIVERTLAASGLPDLAALEAGRWHDCSLPFETMHFLDGFGHPEGRFRFRPDWEGLGAPPGHLPAMPDHPALHDAATAEKPFQLVAAPARNYLNSSFTETPTSRMREARPTAKIHPGAARRLGIAEGDLVRLGNDRATVALHAELFDGLQPEVVVVESCWPNGAFVEGIGINALVSSEPAAPDGGGVFHDTAVWIRKA